MPELTLAEKASCLCMETRSALEAGELPPVQLLPRYFDDGVQGMYVVPSGEEDLDDEERQTLDEVAGRFGFSIRGFLPCPPRDRIIEGIRPWTMNDRAKMAINIHVAQVLIDGRARRKKDAVDEDNEDDDGWFSRNQKDEQALILPGMVVTAKYDQASPRKGTAEGVSVFVYAPAQTRLWTKAELALQVRFGVKTAQLLQQNVDLIINGIPLEDVAPESDPEVLLRQDYPRRLKDLGLPDKPVIAARYAEERQLLIDRLEALEDWESNLEADVLPPESEVIDADRGIVGWQNEGSAVVTAHRNEMPWNFLTRLRGRRKGLFNAS